MANVVKAIDFVLHLEDSTMSGIVTHDSKDHGGRTRFGIAERFHPELTPTGFFDRMPVIAALDLAHQVFRQSYAGPLRIDVLWDQRLANALLSFGVCAGQGTAVKTLQSALASCGGRVVQDGSMGPATVGAANLANPELLFTAFINEQKKHYRQIVADDPSQSRFLDGWIDRANKAALVAA